MIELGSKIETDSGAVFCFVRRAPSDRYYRKPKRGQMLYWKNRKYYLVSTKGKQPAGFAMAELRSGFYGFVQVYGEFKG